MVQWTDPKHTSTAARDPYFLDARCCELEGTEHALRGMFDDRVLPRRTGTPDRLGYQCAEPVLIRVAHLALLELPPWPDLGDPRQGTAWVRKVWSLPGVRDAVEHASPDLARQLDQLGSVVAPARQVRRSVLALAGYMLRMKGRPTPFGLLAGVTEGRFLDATETGAGAGTTACWGPAHRAKAWPGAGWLAEVINDLEASPAVRRRLKVKANNVCERRGERLVVPWTPRPTRARTTSVCERSVYATPLASAALHLARQPIGFADLAAKVQAEHPAAANEKVETVLHEMIEQRLLLTSAYPAATEPDPLGHVLSEMRRAGLEDLPLVRRLGQIHALISQHDEAPAARAADLRRALTRRMNEAHDTPSPLALDLRVDGKVELPGAVAREIESAVTALTRVSPHPHGTPAWRRYHQRFLERYGHRAWVPVTELVDPDIGLGLPEGYLGAEPSPSPEWTPRDKKLVALAQSAARDGIREIELDEHLLWTLTSGDPERMRAPAHIEAAFEVHARTPHDIDRGVYSVTLTNVSRAWGTMTGGRFTSLLESDGRASAMVEALRGLPTTDPDALIAQASSTSLRPDAAHITRVPQLLSATVSVSEHREDEPGTLTLCDLAVMADAQRIHLVSRSTGRPVEVATLHPLQLEVHTLPVIRFLTEISRARAVGLRGYTTFDWGAAVCLPYLPGVRYGRVLLSRPRWRLEEEDLPSRDATTVEWEQALAELRERLGLPSVVRVSYVDERLVLDLDEPLHRALLRRQVERARIAPLTFDEAPADRAREWIGGRPHEIVALLKASPQARQWPSTDPATAVRRRPRVPQPPGTTDRLCLLWPGRPRRQQEIVARHLPHLLSDLSDALPGPPRWWYRCGRDHLLLTLVLPDRAAFGEAAHRVGEWAGGLSDTGMLAGDGLRYVAYRPEYRRWGEADALTAAEHVLAADSAVFAHQLRDNHHPDTRVLAASNMVTTAQAFLGGPDHAAHWLVEHLPKQTRPHLPRAFVAETIRSTKDWAPDGSAEAHRQSVTLLYRAVCDRAPDVEPDLVLTELLYEHHLRAHGPNQEREQDCWHLARAAALSYQARSRQPAR